MKMRCLCLFLAVSVSPIAANSQQPAIAPQSDITQQPAPDELIDHLVANAQLYAQTLPSLVATETIDSVGRYMIFHHRVRATAVFRVLHKPGQPLQESRQITVADGRAVAPGEQVALPSTLFGGFSNFQELFFTPAHRLCYTFMLLPEPGLGGTLQIAVEEQTGVISGCNPRGITGLARIDPVTRHVVHLERTVPTETAIKYLLAPFARVELAPAKIGDETFWLPTTVFGTFANGKVKGSFEAHYSNFHRYTASATILPGVRETEPPKPPPVPPPVMP